MRRSFALAVVTAVKLAKDSAAFLPLPATGALRLVPREGELGPVGPAGNPMVTLVAETPTSALG
ncbi:MAG: hypothetical protein NZ869_01435 [Thermoanaerobaculum sp.]|nr:hypothetical protein [Thermoanaerobaculum sp.]MDW7966824.1 hypothetical protein [Thermoanaerobaculum sp.]